MTAKSFSRVNLIVHEISCLRETMVAAEARVEAAFDNATSIHELKRRLSEAIERSMMEVLVGSFTRQVVSDLILERKDARCTCGPVLVGSSCPVHPIT